eukprot:scaffold278133_cov14-Tisochrysis_lutea.AAC.1
MSVGLTHKQSAWDPPTLNSLACHACTPAPCTPTNALHHACMPQNAFHTHACAATFAPTPLHGFYLCCDGPYCWAKP